MAIKNLNSVFIGIVDILGYSNAEHHIDQFGSQAASVILGSVYNALDVQVKTFNNATEIHWIRYGDGYVFYSDTNDIQLLEKMTKDASRLIALSLAQSIPLRIAITQGDIKIIEAAQDGISITGTGWSTLQNLEKALDWMGGWIYLPNYDNHHHQMITDLISTTNLVIQQNNCSEQSQKFTAPFKSTSNYSKERSWFINWHKVLHQQNNEYDALIKNWWQPFTHTNINGHSTVKTKQNNTRDFANYCNTLYQSAQLIYFSKAVPNLKISEIMNPN